MGKSDSRSRKIVVSFRLVPGDFETLARVAGRLSPGQFARTVALEAAGLLPATPGRRPPQLVKDADLLRSLLAELGHWGGNLNQLAHLANAGHPVGPADVALLRREVMPIRDAVLDALGAR